MISDKTACRGRKVKPRMTVAAPCQQLWPSQSSRRLRMRRSSTKSLPCSLITYTRKPPMLALKKTLWSQRPRRRRNKSTSSCKSHCDRKVPTQAAKTIAMAWKKTARESCLNDRIAPRRQLCAQASIQCHSSTMRKERSIWSLIKVWPRSLTKSRRKEAPWWTSSISGIFWSCPSASNKCCNKLRTSWLSKRASYNRKFQWCRNWWSSRQQEAQTTAIKRMKKRLTKMWLRQILNSTVRSSR